MTKRHIACATAMALLAGVLAGCGGDGSNSPAVNPNPYSGLPANAFVFATIGNSPAPVVPSSGQQSGNTLITLSGAGQLKGNVKIYFGTTLAGSVQILSNSSTSTVLTTVAPKSTIDPNDNVFVDVRIVDENGVSAVTPNDKYEYLTPTSPPAPPT